MTSDAQEQDILHALRSLPVAVIVTPRGGNYIWQCLDGNGSAPSLAVAMSEGLMHMTQAVAGDATVIDDLLSSHRIN